MLKTGLFILFFTSLGNAGLADKSADLKRKTAQDVAANIIKKQKTKGNICAKSSILKETIRTNEGKLCEDPGIAVLVLNLCSGVKDFDQSHCSSLAKGQLMSNTSIEASCEKNKGFRANDGQSCLDIAVAKKALDTCYGKTDFNDSKCFKNAKSTIDGLFNQNLKTEICTIPELKSRYLCK